MNTEKPTHPTDAPSPPVRHFASYQLLRLLGKSDRTMAWRVLDPRSEQELVLVLPRHQPASPAALDQWTQAVRRAGRLDHPNLAAVVASGTHDGWPYVAFDPVDTPTLGERLSTQGMPGAEAAEWAVQALEGLAFAHDAGVVHRDLQHYLVLLGDQNQVRLLGFEVALHADETQGVDSRAEAAMAPSSLRALREEARRDVLAFGLLLHQAIGGQAPLGEADTGHVIARLPPEGREFVRLPFTTAQPIPEPLRAIVNRATDRQERQRYFNARTFARALQGWLKVESEAVSGPLALLLDRLNSVGLLPASPGAADRAARMAMMTGQRTHELARVVLLDIALAFELLRAVNTASVRGSQVAGTGPVLTVRRAIAMLGLDGVRRAALGLRAWPGPLNASNAQLLDKLIERVKRAGRLAKTLRPPGYDPEVVYLVTLLQNLGRLMVQYHFPEEAQQMARLMQPAPPARPGDSEEPGMSEAVASYAVLGIDAEALGAAVARHWGLDATVQNMIRRLPADAQVRAVDSDTEMLRLVASCANEAVDALALPAAQLDVVLQRIIGRYGRVLNLQLDELRDALELLPGEDDFVPFDRPAEPA